jgi:biopolymer transport protein ExbD
MYVTIQIINVILILLNLLHVHFLTQQNDISIDEDDGQQTQVSTTCDTQEITVRMLNKTTILIKKGNSSK